MKRYVKKLLSEVLGSMYENGQISALPSFDILTPKENFGDFTINVAHNIAREGKFNANDVANIIATELKNNDKENMFGEIVVVNGFINIFASKKALAANAGQLNSGIKIEQSGLSKKVIFEYSSPNTNKPLHIGHTRNDVFGKACINLLRAAGFEVVATEIINDRGIHIMKSMLMYIKFGNGETPQSAGVKGDHFVGKYYVMFEQENQEQKGSASYIPEGLTPLEKEALDLLQKWEAGDSEVRELWKKMNSWFYSGLQETYAREGSEFDDLEFESKIYDKGKDLVLKGLAEGIFQKDSDGSVYVDLTSQGLDKKYLLRSNGTTLYITQDLYLWDLRNKKYNPDLAIVTTSSEQAYHFNVLKKIFGLLGYAWSDKFIHLPYEHVYLGKSKMSSRAGNSVSADELLEIVKDKVREVMNQSQKMKASADDDVLVEDIAFAAIKYGFLKYDKNTKIYFDLSETIKIEGNTGPYIQYTHARIKSIAQAAGAEVQGLDYVFESADQISNFLNKPEELSLLRYLLHYEDIVLEAAMEYKPSALCAYLFELASKYNSFYDKISVLKAESEELKHARLALSEATAKVLAHGLALLGIKAPEKI